MSSIPFIDFRGVYEVVRPQELIEEIATCFKMYSQGLTVTPKRTVMYVEGNWWGIMQSYIKGIGVGVKVVSVIPSNTLRGLRTTQGLAVLFDQSTGLPKLIIDGTALTAHRTAAATAVSIRYMWGSKGGVLGLIGAGFQGYHQVLYAYYVMDPDKVLIYDIRREASERLLGRVKSDLGLECRISDDLRDLLNRSDVIIEATTTKTPVIIGDYLNPPTHVASIGAHKPGERAIDDAAVRMSEVFAVDSREAVMSEAGDVIEPLRKGLLREEDVVEIGEIVAGLRAGRVGNGLTIFKTVGIAVEDVCAAHYIWRRIKENK